MKLTSLISGKLSRGGGEQPKILHRSDPRGARDSLIRIARSSAAIPPRYRADSSSSLLRHVASVALRNFGQLLVNTSRGVELGSLHNGAQERTAAHKKL